MAIVLPEAKRYQGPQAVADIKILILQPLNTLPLTSLRNLNPRQRKEWAKELGLASERLARAENYMRQAQRFLVPANLRSWKSIGVINGSSVLILKQFEAMIDES